MRRICVFTGTRAEYGLLMPLMKAVSQDSELELQVLVGGMHLSPEFGLTYRAIEDDGFNIDARVECLLSSDTPVGVCKSMGLGLMGFAEALDQLKPDLLVILGDRFEGLAAAAAAMVCRVPLAHLHGGEATHGLIDEPIRHSITKMSHLHFVSTEEYRRRVIQLGEAPDRVFNFGAIGIDNIRGLKLLSRDELEKELGFELGPRSALVTFHPVTLETATAEGQFQDVLDALDDAPELNVVFTKANADTEGRIINQLIDGYAAARPGRAAAFTSLGQVRYLSLMKQVDVVVGNSSSGIIEAPSFKIPTVNIGDRQKGRVRAASVIDCQPGRASTAAALIKAFDPEFRASLKNMTNPYEQENTAARIKETLKAFDLNGILKKEFYDLPNGLTK